jgi:hypothetical protein
MEKKNSLILALLICALLVIGSSIYYLYTQSAGEEEIEEPQDNDIEVTEPMPWDNINVSYNYLADNEWFYEITGTLPNPCYELTHTVIVDEGTPDQVTIEAFIQEPSEDEMCAQVIQEVNDGGEFQAEEDAEVIFSVELVPSRVEIPDEEDPDIFTL